MYRQVLVLAGVLLAGCSSAKDVDIQQKEDKAAQEQAASVEAGIDDTKCQSYGYKRGTAAYIQCRKDYQAWHKQLGITGD
jgi:outer membrane biogenesis lipoprotein LolB